MPARTLSHAKQTSKSLTCNSLKLMALATMALAILGATAAQAVMVAGKAVARMTMLMMTSCCPQWRLVHRATAVSKYLNLPEASQLS